MSVFGGLEDNAPDGALFQESRPTWGSHTHDSDATAPDAGSTWSQDEPSAGIVPELTTGNSFGNDQIGTQSGESGSQTGTQTDTQPVFTDDAHNGAANAARDRKRRKRLTVTVTRIEQTRTEPIIWFDVAANLPRFRSSYKDVRRTHQEMRRFANHLRNANPECFVPALPGPSNSLKTNAERDEKLGKDIQKWFNRITRSPLLIRDEEFLYFVEAVTGYVPVVKIKPPATGLARLVIKQRQPPPDDVDELREFRPQAKLLYKYSDEFRQKLERVSKARRELGAATLSFSQQVAKASHDDAPYLTAMWDQVARASKIQADTEMKKTEIQEATLGDTMELVGNEAFFIKETLTNRHLLIRDFLKSQAATRDKHQRATQLRGASDISPARVDEAIVQLEAAAQLEKRITTTVRRVSDNLVAEKHLALARIESDILESVAAYTLQTIDQDRRVLAAWENARPEVRAADPNGGLGHLGREQVSPRRHRFSQSKMRDDWSDRDARARDFKPAVSSAANGEPLDRKAVVSMLTSDSGF